MNAHYPTADEPATPDYVMSVIRDMHRQQAQFDDEADGEALLTFDTTVAQWRQARDLLVWQSLGRGLNATWSIEGSEAEWKAVLQPEHEKRLSDVCAFIARRASRPRIRAARIFGRTCVPAGAFLTIRSLLHEAGVDVRVIRPSTPLSSFTRRYLDVFLDPISRLAPGALPPVRVSTRYYDAATLGCVVGLLVLVAGSFVGSAWLTTVGGIVYALAYALKWITARCLSPSSVQFGSFRTFRDLAVALAGTPEA